MNDSSAKLSERELHQMRPRTERLRLRIAFLLRFGWAWLAVGSVLVWWGVTTTIERKTSQLPAGVEAAVPAAPTWLPSAVAILGVVCLIAAWRKSSSWLFAGDERTQGRGS
jgi:hypothetical protein